MSCSTSQKYTLDSLTTKAAEINHMSKKQCTRPCEKQRPCKVVNSTSHCDTTTTPSTGSWNAWVWFIVLAVIIGFLLWVSCPDFITCYDYKNKCRCLNWGSWLLWTIGIALVIVVLFWLFGGYGKN